MNTPVTDYERIARAIEYLAGNVTSQPRLEEVAAHVHLSPFHFQRLFRRWAGTTPKRFLQVLTLERSRQLLHECGSLLELTHAVGLSSGSRLHGHFVTLDAVTPGEYRNRGRGVTIRHGVHASPFGELFVALTARGVCRAAFVDGGDEDVTAQLDAIRRTWPEAELLGDSEATRHVVDAITGKTPGDAPLSLHVAGTNFQVAVWRALLAIPEGAVASYAQVATAIDRPRASRAVGGAVGANPVALLIPCHRVITASGALGQYRWGTTRKHAIQVRERARLDAATGA